MKKVMTSTILATLLFVTTVNAGNDQREIETLVKGFVKSGDKQDVTAMTNLLHSDYRAILNRLFGSEEVSLLDKNTYLGMLREKKLGGDDRTVDILFIDIHGNTASVKAIFDGKTTKFTTYLLMVKNVEGNWQIISDMPEIASK